MKTVEETRRDRLWLLVKEVGSVAELARRFGRQPAQISQWLHGYARTGSGKPRVISSGSARQIESAFGKGALWMDRPLDDGADINGVAVPLLENVASMGGGTDLETTDVMAGELCLTKLFVREELRVSNLGALRFLHARGDSMEPTLHSGDVLLVDTSVQFASVDGIYVLRAHDRLFIKRVRQRIDGKFEISSDNPTHRTVDVLDGGHEVQILGRVVWFWNGHRVM